MHLTMTTSMPVANAEDDDSNASHAETEAKHGPAADETLSPPNRKRKRKRKRKSLDNESNTPEDNDQVDKESKNDKHSASDEHTSKEAQLDRTVFVEGIPFDSDEQQIREWFQQQHKVQVDEIRLPTWQDSGRLRGYGHVVLATTADREAALQLSGQYLGSRYLTIQQAQAPKSNTSTNQATASSRPSKTIMLRNLSYDATEDDVRAILEQYGAIAPGGVRVVRHAHTARSKGFGYVEFRDLRAAQSAIQDNIVVLGRSCTLDYDHGRVKHSFRTENGKLWINQHGKRAGE